MKRKIVNPDVKEKKLHHIEDKEQKKEIKELLDNKAELEREIHIDDRKRKKAS